ncbi:MAG: ABC transporter permease [Nitrososphaeria archaeon]
MNFKFLDKYLILESISIVIIFLLGLLAPIITPKDPLKTGYHLGLSSPSIEFPLGTDQLGRDVLSWVIHGIRAAFIVGIISFVITFLIALLGMFSGYYGGRIDQLMVVAMDIMMSVPRFVLVVILCLLFGGNIINISVIIGIVSWPTLARIMREETLSFKEREFILSAKVIGCSSIDIMFKEIFPNIVPSLIPSAVLQFSHAIIDEVGVSFLGLGDPNIASWGRLIAIGRTAIFAGGWWVLLFPILLCSVTLICLNMLADKLNDLLNPRHEIK